MKEMNQGQKMIGLLIQKEAIMKDQKKKKNMCLEIFHSGISFGQFTPFICFHPPSKW